VGRRWSYADVTSFRHRTISSAIHRTRPWSALAHPTTLCGLAVLDDSHAPRHYGLNSGGTQTHKGFLVM
jgi:hypothetical protein